MKVRKARAKELEEARQAGIEAMKSLGPPPTPVNELRELQRKMFRLDCRFGEAKGQIIGRARVLERMAAMFETNAYNAVYEGERARGFHTDDDLDDTFWQGIRCIAEDIQHAFEAVISEELTPREAEIEAMDRDPS